MKVTRIRGFRLRATLPEPIGNALVFFVQTEALLVQLVSDEGVVGWGEVWASPEAAAAHIRTHLAPLVSARTRLPPVACGAPRWARCITTGAGSR
jgi:D-galactarolactone cycloisomerase